VCVCVCCERERRRKRKAERWGLRLVTAAALRRWSEPSAIGRPVGCVKAWQCPVWTRCRSAEDPSKLCTLNREHCRDFKTLKISHFLIAVRDFHLKWSFVRTKADVRKQPDHSLKAQERRRKRGASRLARRIHSFCGDALPRSSSPRSVPRCFRAASCPGREPALLSEQHLPSSLTNDPLLSNVRSSFSPSFLPAITFLPA